VGSRSFSHGCVTRELAGSDLAAPVVLSPEEREARLPAPTPPPKVCFRGRNEIVVCNLSLAGLTSLSVQSANSSVFTLVP
jgi:hypothetical protein